MTSAAPQAQPRLLHGRVGKVLLRLSAPMLLGIASIVLFNVVDTFYVGQLGVEPLAAMSFTFPVSFIVTSVSMGLGVGTVSAISRAIGRGQSTHAARLATHGLVLGFVVVAGVGALGIATLRPVFSLLGAGPAAIEQISDYMVPWFAGVCFLSVPMVGNSAIRATGDTKTPSLIMLTAGVVNLVLDPLLIFGLGPFPRLELLGAALSTIASWMVAFAGSLWVLARRKRLLTVALPTLTELQTSWVLILRIGIPATATQVLTPLSAAVFTRLLAGFGSDSVAAYGVATRLEALALIGAMALGSALTPFAGQNYGARDFQRLREALNFSIRASLLWGLGTAALYAVFGRALGSLFNDSARVVEQVAVYLWIVPVSYAGFGITMAVGAMLNGVNRPLGAMLVVFVRLFAFALPLAAFGGELFGVTGIFAGISIANWLSAGLGVAFMRGYLRAAAREG